MKLTYVDKDLTKKVYEGCPYSALTDWAKNHFPCFNLADFDLIKHIRRVCLYRMKDEFPLDENRGINEVSISILHWLQEHNVRMTIE